MIDRKKSILGSLLHDQSHQFKKGKPQYYEIIQQMNLSSELMKGHIRSYKGTVNDEQGHQYISNFKKEQALMKRCNKRLKQELNQYEDQEGMEHQLIKQELIKGIKKEMNLELQLTQQVNKVLKSKEKRQKELNIPKLIQKQIVSKQLEYLLEDILAKREEIIYLQQSLRQCLELIQAFGLLTAAQGEKIKDISEAVREANQKLTQAQKIIDIQRKKTNDAHRRCCCILIVALLALVIAGGIVLGIYLTKA